MDGWIIPLIGGSAFRQTRSQVASLKLYRTDCSNEGKPGEGWENVAEGTFSLHVQGMLALLSWTLGKKMDLVNALKSPRIPHKRAELNNRTNRVFQAKIKRRLWTKRRLFRVCLCVNKNIYKPVERTHAHRDPTLR